MVAVTAIATDSADDDRRVPEREEQSDRDRTLPLLHQLARHVVDRRDVVGIDRVPQPERIRQQRRAQQQRPRRECHQRERPHDHRRTDQQHGRSRRSSLARSPASSKTRAGARSGRGAARLGDHRRSFGRPSPGYSSRRVYTVDVIERFRPALRGVAGRKGSMLVSACAPSSAARRHPRHRGRQLHGRPVLRDAARRSGR